eukprot:TRINITY_DN5972_c0_g1_i2.p1 TRINITY_DN5972_c0_g1~~TRINITY_DN5972_c0_g1_i2.p1  ORF type:complete len:232 (-),score=43.38 TRINITY_DN5972_c0_g1_i2:10-660(-)
MEATQTASDIVPKILKELELQQVTLDEIDFAAFEEVHESPIFDLIFVWGQNMVRNSGIAIEFKPTMNKWLLHYDVKTYDTTPLDWEKILSEVASHTTSWNAILPSPNTPPPTLTRAINTTSYENSIFRVLKQVHPDMSISPKGMCIINSMVNDILTTLARDAAIIAKSSNKTTLTSKEIQEAVSTRLKGQLAAHAMAEGTKALHKFAQEVPVSYTH